MARRSRQRGVTLVEVLITVAIIGIAMGLTMLGASVADGARLRRSAVMIAGAVRVGYGHANAVSKVVRLSLDFTDRMVTLEETANDYKGGELKLAKNDVTGGAAGATEAEQKAIAEADAILKGPRTPRPAFQPTKPFGWNPDKDRPGKELEKNIRFLQIETGHQDLPLKTGRAYLYFWPGGQTERAAIQLSINGSDVDADVMTLIISPLTGKAELRRGKYFMPRPRDDAEGSERQDTGY
jgi:general secretion pathway protein H